jgi:hypothetical protein
LPKDPNLRARKYEAKFDADVVRARFNVMKPLAVEQSNAYQAQLASLEGQVRNILAAHGYPTWQNPVYMNSGREMLKKFNGFSGETLTNEILAIVEKYAAKELIRATLCEIAALFGVSCAGY